MNKDQKEELTEKAFVDWESHVFGYGYGTGEKYTLVGMQWFMQKLEGGMYHYDDIENRMSPIAAWLIINLFCHQDIIEYGTSPRHGWLTDKGKLLRDFLEKRTIYQLEELVMADHQDDFHYGCTTNWCNCGEKQVEGKCKNNPLF